MPDPARRPGAVFLSYASQDAQAAERICEGLRGAGIEVWLDRSELQGGEAWDAQIRKRIHECTLFLPVISANTNARSEGYFRREWNLASRRLLDMALDAPFLMPVLIDSTQEAESRVPEEFLGVQWTRLPAGQVTHAFVQRVRQLLSGDVEGKHAPVDVQPAARLPTAPLRARERDRKRRKAVGLGAIGLALIFGAGWLWYGRGGPGPSVMPTTGDVQPSAQTATNEKSIAVLPFTDMSERQDQEYFADGLAEELIDHLAHSAELKVIARSSSFAFKGKNVDARSIARQLNVANLLQGSVRKVGSQLRITTQLIQATDGALVWSETYVRKLDDVFAIQDEISTTVAKALDARMSAASEVGARAASNVTGNMQAYNLLLQGNYYYWRGNPGDDEKSIELYLQALELDPKYVSAWAKLARAYAWRGSIGDLSAAEAEAKGRNAVERALAIDPDCAEAYFASGHMHRFLMGEWRAALSDYERAAALEPHGPVGDDARGSIAILGAALSGDFAEALDWFRLRLERSPIEAATMSTQATYLRYAGRLQESSAISARLLELNPSFATAHADYGLTLALMDRGVEAVAIAQGESAGSSRFMALAIAEYAANRRAESDAALGALRRGFSDRKAYEIAGVHAFRGEADDAFEWLDRAYRQRRGSLESLKINPLFRGLRGDPRFDAWLRTAKVVE